MITLTDTRHNKQATDNIECDSSVILWALSLLLNISIEVLMFLHNGAVVGSNQIAVDCFRTELNAFDIVTLMGAFIGSVKNDMMSIWACSIIMIFLNTLGAINTIADGWMLCGINNASNMIEKKPIIKHIIKDCASSGSSIKENGRKERLQITINKRFGIHKFDQNWLIGELIENEHTSKRNINLNITDIDQKYRLAYTYGCDLENLRNCPKIFETKEILTHIDMFKMMLHLFSDLTDSKRDILGEHNNYNK